MDNGTFQRNSASIYTCSYSQQLGCGLHKLCTTAWTDHTPLLLKCPNQCGSTSLHALASRILYVPAEVSFPLVLVRLIWDRDCVTVGSVHADGSVSVCLSVCLSACLPACLSVCLSVTLSLSLVKSLISMERKCFNDQQKPNNRNCSKVTMQPQLFSLIVTRTDQRKLCCVFYIPDLNTTCP